MLHFSVYFSAEIGVHFLQPTKTVYSSHDNKNWRNEKSCVQITVFNALLFRSMFVLFSFKLLIPLINRLYKNNSVK